MIYDVAIIGGGPAGMSAAIYAARGRYENACNRKNRIRRSSNKNI